MHGTYQIADLYFLRLLTMTCRGSLPRQLLLETLDSIQKVLFPIFDVNDTKAEKLLRSLVSTVGFDRDSLRYESSSIRRTDEKTVSYFYWGARLADLYQEMEDPTPRGLVDTWLDRRSGNRYLMLATLIGVIFAVIIGLASLGVGAFEAYVGYQQWQHPVSR